MYVDSDFYLRADARILIKDASAKHDDDPMFGVFHAPRDGYPYVVCDNGLTYRTRNHGYETNEEVEGQPKRVVVAWSLPLPQLADNQTIAFYHKVVAVAEASKRASYGRYPAFFYVETVNDDVAEAKLVYSKFASHRRANDFDVADEHEVVIDRLVVADYPIYIDRKSLPAELKPKSLILTNEFSCWSNSPVESADERVTTTVGYVEILVEDLPLSELQRYIPSYRPSEENADTYLQRGFKPACLSTACVANHYFEIDKARACNQPNIALVWADPYGDVECDMNPIIHRGIEMYQLDDLSTYFRREKFEPGFYLFKDAKFSAWSYATPDGTEWDTDLGGTYVRASEADLALFGVTLQDVADILADYYSDEDRSKMDFVALAHGMFFTSEPELGPATVMTI